MTFLDLPFHLMLSLLVVVILDSPVSLDAFMFPETGLDGRGRYGWVTQQQQQQQPSCRTNAGSTQVRPLMLMMLPSLGDDGITPARIATGPIRRTTATTASSSSLIASNGPSMLQQQELPSASSYRSSHYVREWMQTQTTQSSSQSMTQLLLADAAVVSPSFASPFQTTTPARSPPPPTKQEVALLQQAFATFYGSVPNPQDALPLLNQVVLVWERQPADERAGLYRVRGDCHMALLQPEQAMQDYSTAISLLRGPGGGEMADPAELPASYLGRARAVRSLGTSASTALAHQAVTDYEETFRLSSREEWDTPEELLLDGARTNPYAAWEYGMALRLDGQLDRAQEMHVLASQYFDDIGDRARSVISLLDAAIDGAAQVSGGRSSSSTKDPAAATNTNTNTAADAKALLLKAIARTKTVEGRDVPLLQRVIAKEGEGRMALATLEWSTTGERQEAETQLSLTCQRLDQLEVDALQRQQLNPERYPSNVPPKLTFSIDDLPGALDTSCTRLKNQSFLKGRLEWPVALQEKAMKLVKLSS